MYVTRRSEQTSAASRGSGNLFESLRAFFDGPAYVAFGCRCRNVKQDPDRVRSMQALSKMLTCGVCALLRQHLVSVEEGGSLISSP